MVRTKRFRAAVAAVALLAVAAVHAGQIRYQAIDLTDTTAGQDRWQYQYGVSGFTFLQDWGLDVLFPIAEGYRFGDLQASLPSPNADWDVISIQPDPLLPDPGRLDALALVDSASTANRFLIDFIWRGAGTPASQPFTIFDANLRVVAEGRTIPFGPAPVPEPATWLLLLTGLGVASRFGKRR